MNTIYFIDNESIKRTAKSIQKQNQTIKYTVILDDLSKLLGYNSYNHYEHYLTNLMLSKNTDINSLKVLTKIDYIDLILLEKQFLEILNQKNYSINSLYFIKKTLEQQKEAYLDHKDLNLYSYIHYLPLFLDYYGNIDTYKEQKLITKEIVHILTQQYESIDKEYIFKLIKKIKDSDDYLKDQEIMNVLLTFKNNLKLRGLYYYIKSIIEDLEYEESYLTSLVLNVSDVEKIILEINQKLINIDLENKNIIPLIKESKETIVNNLFPFIKENLTDNNKIILGRNLDMTPCFATDEMMRSNILVTGLPGTGKSIFNFPILFQCLMNNRGFGIINVIENIFISKYVDYLVKVFNKKEDIFNYNSHSNLRSLPSAINNDKIILINGNNKKEYRASIDGFELGNKSFANILVNLNNYTYKNKFKNKKTPFYILIEESQYITELSLESKEIIKKLNTLNIFFIFDSQLNYPYLEDIVKTKFISNASLQYYANNNGSPVCDLAKKIINTENIVGLNGITPNHNPAFSLFYENTFIKQLYSELDTETYSILSSKFKI